jgi:hypothetical protein
VKLPRQKTFSTAADLEVSYPVLSILFLSLLVAIPGALCKAAEIEFPYIKANADTIVTECALVDSIPQRLSDYIDKGVPVSFEYRIELWKVRRGWFDHRIGSFELNYKVRYDTWSKKYTVVQIDPHQVIEHILSDRRGLYDLVSECGPLSFLAEDTSAHLYLVGTLSIKVLTLSSFREVESWLKGEISGAKKPDIDSAGDKFGEFLFDAALKITGFENISARTRTGDFKLENLPMESGDSEKP